MSEQVRRETWEDWQSPLAPTPHLLTRAELLELAQRVGQDADERDLRYWESEGVLPGPVRRWHNGATRALYPSWMVTLIFQLRLYQSLGYRLDELPSRLRIAAQRLSSLPPEQRGAVAGLPATEEWVAGIPLGEPIIADDNLANTIRMALLSVALPLRLRFGIPIVRAKVTLIDAHGRELEFPIELDETN